MLLLPSLLLVGCGSIGEPLYPALNVPTRIVDLTAVQRGDKIDIRFTVPKLTTEGLVVKQIGSVDVRMGPSNAGTFNANDWANGAQKINVSPVPEPGAARAEQPVQGLVGKEVIVGVRLGNTKGRMSDWSNFVPVTIEAPLAKPADLKAESVAEGVRLTWNEPNVTAFRIFRKTGEQKEPTLLATPDKPDYVDTTTEYEKTYQYYVQGIHDKTESDVVESNAVTPKDIFPPQVPTGLTASVGIGAIDLAWTRNTESDFKEYRVFRSEENGPFVQIAAGLDGPIYSDHQIQSGKHYRYRVSAVDQVGNPSQPSEPIEVIAP
ncbi:MAG: hypothetical protein ABSE86_05245 [Bryobacteraceae bacterium]